MDSLIRLVYASTAVRPADNAIGAIQVDVGRILMQSRKNNPKYQIGGVLYFSNNYFFQCLEGGQEVVNKLYNRIADDPRHTNIQSLSVKRISERLYTNWSMKHVASEENVQRLIKESGYKSFNPYRLDDELIERMLRLFIVARDSTGTRDQHYARYNVSTGSRPKQGWFNRLFGRTKRVTS